MESDGMFWGGAEALGGGDILEGAAAARATGGDGATEMDLDWVEGLGALEPLRFLFMLGYGERVVA